MPVYRIRVPDGRVIRVQGTDPDTASQSASEWASANRGPAPVTAGGVAKSFGSGALGGFLGLGNMGKPGGDPDLISLLNQGGKFLATHVGGQSDAQAQAGFTKAEAVRRMIAGPTASEAQSAAHLQYTPRNGVERVANVAGGFLPNAFVPGMGEANMARNAAGAVLRVAAPTVGATVAPAVVKAAGGNETAQNVASVVGGVVGGGLPNAFKGGVNATRQAVLGTSRSVSPEIADLAQAAMEKHGIPLHTAQIAAAGGDRAAAIRYKNLLSTDPRFQAANAAQQAAFTDAAGKTFGAEPGGLTTDNMAGAKARLSAGFTQHAASTGVAADPQLDAALSRIQANSKEIGLSDNEVGAIDKQVAKIREAATAAPDGVIPGKTYLGLTESGSPLDNIISGRGTLATQGKAIKTALSDAAARAGGPEAQQQLDNLRSQWAAMKTVEPLAEKAGAEGIISPALLRGRVNATYDNAAYGSGGDLKELGDIGQTFLKEAPSSNTSELGFDRIKRPGAIAAGLAGLGEATSAAFHSPQLAIGSLAAAGGGYAANVALKALKSARADNPIATNALLGGYAAPMPARVLNALALDDPAKYATTNLAPVATLGAINAFGQAPAN